MAGNHRVAANTKAGRKLVSVGADTRPWTIPQDVRDHNRMVDEKKAAKRLARLQKRTAGGAQ